jgi:signal transduction histidine kinase
MIRVSFDKDTIVTKVIDQGPGIDSHDLPNIFEPFFRSNDTRKIHGYGIGLSLVKKTIEVHKGNIKVISAPKQGTTMIVTLYNSRKRLEQETLELDLI